MISINKIRITSLSLTSLVITISIFFYSINTKQVFEQHAKSSIEKNAVNVENKIKIEQNYAMSSIKLASFLSLQTMNERELKIPEKKLEQLILNSPFDSCQYIRWDGKITIDYPFGKDNRIYSDEQFFKNAMNGDTGMFFEIDPLNKDDYLFRFYTPLFYKNEFSGVIIGTMKANRRIKNTLSSSLFGMPTDGILCDKDLTVICSTLKKYPTGTVLSEDESDPLVKNIIKNIKTRNSNSWFWTEFGQKGLACFSNDNEQGLYSIQIVTPLIYNKSMRKIANSSYLFIFIVLISLLFLILTFIYIAKKRTQKSQNMLKNTVQALGLTFDNIYITSIQTGITTSQKQSNFIKKTYGKAFSYGKYEQLLKTYVQKEVIQEDKYLFEQISTISKLENLLCVKNEHSFIYRVERDGKIHFFEFLSILFEEDSNIIITTFKKVDGLINTTLDSKEIENVQEALNFGRWSINFDVNRKICKVQWSDKIRNMFGYKDENDFPNEISSWSSLIHSDESSKVQKIFNDTIYNPESNNKLDCTYRVLTKRNGWKWFHSIATLSRREDGSPFHFIGYTIDIDNEKRQQQNLIAITKSYLSLHFIDLVNRTFYKISDSMKIVEQIDSTIDASVQLNTFIKEHIMPQFLEKAIIFVDLDSLPERMKEKRFITIDFNDNDEGWIRASFITVEKDKDERPISVIFATQQIYENNRNI